MQEKTTILTLELFFLLKEQFMSDIFIVKEKDEGN